MISASVLQAEVRLELSRGSITTDETVNLLLKFDSEAVTAIPRIPLPDGLEILGVPGREIITINGVTDNRVRYTLKADKPGEYKIGPFRIEGKNGEANIDAVTLTVTPATVIQSTENLFVTLESSSDEILVNQTVELTMTFYSRVRTSRINLEGFEENGFELSEWQQVQALPKEIGGRRYNVERYVAGLTPTKTGKLQFDPNFQVHVIDRDEPYNMLFGSRSTRIQRIKLKEPLVLEVKNPPAEGRPDDYTGHLGNFRLNATVSPREINVGDPVTLQVELSGTGSLQQALPPGLKESDDFKVYEPKLIADNSERKIIEQVVIPRHAEVTEIPALTFSYYDPLNKKYKTLQSGPFPLQVNGGEYIRKETSVISSLPSNSGSTEIELLGDDLLYLKTRPGEIRSVQSLQPGIRFVTFSGLPFAIWALTGLIFRHREKKEEDESGRRRQQAPRRLRKHLNQLEDPKTDPHSQIWNILSEYLAARLNLPPGELNPSDAAARLENKVKPETLEATVTWMRQCERARFAGNSASQTDTETRKNFRTFILQLDQELGK